MILPSMIFLHQKDNIQTYISRGARMRMAVTDAARKLSKHPLNIIFMIISID